VDRSFIITTKASQLIPLRPIEIMATLSLGMMSNNMIKIICYLKTLKIQLERNLKEKLEMNLKE